MTTVSIGGLRTLGDQPRAGGHRQSVPARDEREQPPYWDTLEHRKAPSTAPRKERPKDTDDDDELPVEEDPEATEPPESPMKTLSMEVETVRIWATDAYTGETLTDAYVDVERVVSRRVALQLPDGTTLEFEDTIPWP